MKKYIFIIITFFLISCNFNTVYKNREEDREEAQKITDKFYNYLEGNNEKEAFKFASKSLFKVTPIDKFRQILTASTNECGKIKNYSLIHWETSVIKGTNSRSEYVLIYDVDRTIKKTTEKFTLKKENDSIKIVGYNIEFK